MSDNSTAPRLQFSPEAREVLEGMIGENPDLHPSIYVKGPGCGGPSLGIEMREAMDTDIVTEQEGLTLHIRLTAAPYIESARIRFEDTFWGKKLKVKRPRGCG